MFRQVCFGSALLFLAIYSPVCLPLSVHSATLSNFTVDNASLVREKLKPNADKFTLKGAFQLTADANDANPTQEQVVFSLGPFSQTIPANTFTQKDGPKKSTWKFKGAKGGLTSVVIAKTSDAWTVTAIASELSFGDVIETNPVRLSLQIGDESGAVDLYFLKKSSTKRTLFKFPSGEKDDADGDGKTEKEGDCDDSDPMVYTGASELCDGVDNDCDKKVDEDFDKGATCTVGAGACVRTGVKVCAPDGTETVCNVTPGTTSLELCGNGLDDDCDGEVDEGFNLGAPCTVGIGACQRSGVLICSQDRGSAVCDSTPGMPTTEVCNSIDDNCNGQTDEGLGTISCGQGGCEHTVAACVNGQPEVCTPGTPKAEICGNGIDEDCNGSDLTCVTTLDIAITGPANLSSTNQPLVPVNGTVDPTATEVTCNGRTMGINKNGNTFGGSVPLKEGSNILTCVAENDAGEVGSASISVTLDSTPPRITIDSPQDNAVVISTPITVTGMVNDLVMGTVNGDEAGVTCNGVQALVANRRFVAENIPLKAGANPVMCIGEDEVGNIDTAHITVTLDTTTQAKISIVSGNNQTEGIGTLLLQPLVVALTENGAPAVGKVVVFKVLQNDGVLSTNTDNGRILGVPTDTNGRASVQFKLGSWAGAGNNQVEVMASGFVGEVRFSASALPAGPNSIVVDAGNMQFGAVGQLLPKPFIATVIDRGSNRLGGVPVTFRVVQGGGNFDGQPEKIVTTDSDGRAQAVLTLGPDEGFDNNLVEANFAGSAGFAATFTASGKTPGKPDDTKISGVVLDNSNNPIQGVTLHVEGRPDLTTQSDEQGQFVLQPAPVGKVLLTADGSTVPPRNGLPWPKLEYELVTIAGQDNAIGMPIHLLPIDTPRGLLVDETHGGTLTLDELPGFALTIVPGSATFPNNTKRGTVSVTLVHADKVPMVPNFGQQPRFIITIQPPGTHFNPPAALTMPNVDGFAPGQKTEMYSFDHDLGSFVSIGPATVSEDGTMVQSDPGVGVVKGGWHCGGNPATNVCLHNCGECQVCQDPPCQCMPDDNAIPTSLTDLPQDCKKPACLGGSPRQVPNDNDLPPADPPGNCLRSDCHEGLTILRLDDSDVPPNVPNDCLQQVCENGSIVSRPDNLEQPSQTSNNCRREVCLNGQVSTVPDDSDLPLSDPPGNCLRPDCRDGLTILRVDDSDTPHNKCETCLNGDIIFVEGCVDTDGDGIPDNQDSDPNDPNKCRDADSDTCDDCNSGKNDPANDGPDLDGDGGCDAGDPDIDGDEVPNNQDTDPTDPNKCKDVDHDTCDDCSSGRNDPANDGPDLNGDGICNKVKSEFVVIHRAYIPSNYVPGPGCVFFNQPHSTVFSGDNRIAPGLSGSFRTQSTMKLTVTDNSDGIVEFSPIASSSREYAFDALEAGCRAIPGQSPPCIDINDNDSTLLDCSLLHATAPNSRADMHVNVLAIRETSITTRIFGGARNSLVPLSPSINWDIEMTGASSGQYVVSGKHDCFPAHEIFVNGQLVYSFLPTGTPPFDLLQIGSCLSGQGQITFGPLIGSVPLVNQ